MDPDNEEVRRVDFLPWEFDPASDEGARQAQRQSVFLAAGATIGDRVFIAPNAAVYCDDGLVIGDRTYVAALTYLTGNLRFGADCSVNPFAVVRGEVTVGDGVRIGAHSSILGFNHFSDVDRPVFTQGIFSKGITIGDDVWIGSNATILDGVTIGDHCIIAAGAIVTKPIPAYSVAAGNPARVLRDRREGAKGATKPGPVGLEARLAAFSASAAGQVGDILQRSFEDGRFVDRPSALVGPAEPALRPWTDAIELSSLLAGDVPPGFDRQDLARRLQSTQDPATGLIAQQDISDRGRDTDSRSSEPLDPFFSTASYHILSVGYALNLLDAKPLHPVNVVQALSARDIAHTFESFDWGPGAWASGSAADCVGTAVAWNMRHFAEELDDGGVGPLYALLGWLSAHNDPGTGVWGAPQPEQRWLQSVNGFYRLTRGTYAQFGVPLPHPEATIRTVLEHSREGYLEGGAGYTACNYLDIVHPLWLAGKQTDAGRPQGQAWALAQLDAALGNWVDGEGFAFAPRSPGADAVPGLQGTEMWLSIVWTLADYLGVSGALGYRPQGVHRPEPLIQLGRATESRPG